MKKTEIKIPKGCKATMYQDGDKIIVEYEEKKKFKNGDFLIVDESERDIRSLLIYDGKKIFNHLSYHALIGRNILHLTPSYGVDAINAREMTESERQELLDALHKIGKDWDAEKLQIVDYEWKPKYGDIFYVPALLDNKLYNEFMFSNHPFDVRARKYKIAFRTKEEAITKTKQMLGIQ